MKRRDFIRNTVVAGAMTTVGATAFANASCNNTEDNDLY